MKRDSPNRAPHSRSPASSPPPRRQAFPRSRVAPRWSFPAWRRSWWRTCSSPPSRQYFGSKSSLVVRSMRARSVGSDSRSSRRASTSRASSMSCASTPGRRQTRAADRAMAPGPVLLELGDAHVENLACERPGLGVSIGRVEHLQSVEVQREPTLLGHQQLQGTHPGVCRLVVLACVAVEASELCEIRRVAVAGFDQQLHLSDRAVVGLKVPVALNVDHRPRVVRVGEDSRAQKPAGARVLAGEAQQDLESGVVEHLSRSRRACSACPGSSRAWLRRTRAEAGLEQVGVPDLLVVALRPMRGPRALVARSGGSSCPADARSPGRARRGHHSPHGMFHRCV